MIRNEAFSRPFSDSMPQHRPHFTTEHSPLTLFRTLLDTARIQGASYRDVDMLYNAGIFMEKAFPSQPKRHEEVQVEQAVHSYRVALRLVKSGFISPGELGLYGTIAALHDTVEDTSVRLADIREVFGEEVAQGVHLLSNKVDGKKIPIKTYFGRLAKAPAGIRWLKVEDRIENLAVLLRMSTVDALTKPNEKNEVFRLPSNRTVADALQHNTEETREYIMQLAHDNQPLAAELEAYIQQAETAVERLVPPSERRDVVVA